MKIGRSAIACLFALLGALGTVADEPATKPADVNASIKRGVEFLVKSQNPDGSWGTGTKTTGFEVYSIVPGSMDGYKSGPSALCVMALGEAGETTAPGKGLGFLNKAPQPRRDDGELMYNTW